jgi:hypothetical protein
MVWYTAGNDALSTTSIGAGNMNANGSSDWRSYLSPLKLSLLAVNAVCFGACVVLLTFGSGGGPLVLLTIGTGLSAGAGLTGAIIASRKNSAGWRRQRNPV